MTQNLIWQMPQNNFDRALKKFRHYLISNGYRSSTIDGYVDRIGRYLKFAKTDRPLPEDATNFRDSLLKKNPARNTINNYTIAITAYHRFFGEEISLPMLRVSEQIPYYFDEEDITKIFGAIDNFKHYTMFHVLFYGCLRASELCNLDVNDVDLRTLSLRIREGKNGRNSIVPMTKECADVLRRYLDIRPTYEIDNRQPLFVTERDRRWNRHYLYKTFMIYKVKADVNKPGGLHVFGRHSPASILVKNGCDLLTIQRVMRHNDIGTTVRYTHINDQIVREKHERFLTL